MLGHYFKKDYYEVDAAKKDREWAKRLVSEFRKFMLPMVDPVQARENRAYLLGEQSVEKYKKKFQAPDKMPFDFSALAIFEKHRNTLTAEREKSGVYVGINAMDATAMDEKEADRKLLENRKSIEGVMSYLDQSMGGPRYNLLKDKGADGEKLFNGNVEQFDKLGLDANESDDISFFFETYHRLDAEAAAETAVNHFVRTHELQKYISMWTDDILATKAVAGRVFTDQITFTPIYKYYSPETIYWIRGARRDGKDARAIMHMENITVHEFLNRVGMELDAESINTIIQSVNFSAGTTTGMYDGVMFSDGSFSREGCTNAIRYDEFLSMKIGVGYIEWKSSNCSAAKVGRNSFGNYKRWPVTPHYRVSDRSKYKKEEIWNQVTYKCTFLATSSSDQEIYDFGTLFDMRTYGSEDEYSSYSFQLYKSPGKPAVEIAKPHIDIIHDAWYRFNWILNKAKPSGTRYNYDVIAKIATKMYQNMDQKNAVLSVIQMFQNSIDDFYVNDTLNKNVGGGQNPHFEKKGGLDTAVKDFFEVMEIQDRKIGDKLGTNALEPFTPAANEGYKLRLQAMAQSRNATDYMARMLMSMLDNYAIHTMTIVQDMCQYRGSDAYHYLTKAIGNRAVLTIRALKKVPLHKYNIFVDSFNNEQERQERKRDAYEAFQKGEIPYHVYILISSIDNPKKAAQVLMYEKNKEQKRKAKEIQQAHNNAMEFEQTKHKLEMERIALKNKGPLDAQREQNAGMIKIAEMDNQTKLQVKEMGIEAEPSKNQNRTDNKIREAAEKKRIERQEPLETTDV